MHPAVHEWINQSTTGVRISKYAYGTARDSKKTAEAWREYLPHYVTLEVNRICKDAMVALGYRTGEDLDTYENLTQSLVGEFPLSSYISL